MIVSIFFLVFLIQSMVFSTQSLNSIEEAIKTNNACHYKTQSACTTCTQDPSLCKTPSSPKIRIGKIPDKDEIPNIDANKVCFYLKENYKGEALCMKAGETLNICSKKLGTVKLPDQNIEGKWCDYIRSIQLGSNIAMLHGITFGGSSSTQRYASIAKDILSQFHVFKAYAKGSSIPDYVDIKPKLDLDPPHIPKIDPNQVCFYLDSYYRGESKCMKAGETLNLCDKKFGTQKLPDGTIEGKWCETYESVLLGSNIAWVYGNRIFGGIASTQRYGSAPNNLYTKFHAFKAYAKGSPAKGYPTTKLDVPEMTIPTISSNQACLYRQRNYRGPSLCVDIGKEVNLCDEAHGGYKLKTGEPVGLWCGNIKSILFGSNVKYVYGTYISNYSGNMKAWQSLPKSDILDYHKFRATSS